ncbi:MAG TPA: prenyltransferase/squalene oxidase repeat-containing protein [Mycobacteriales bacterium]|nr:prenyltransferase/squalene oxidase repeat-containing protein [Mycobacteriales bacterium]
MRSPFDSRADGRRTGIPQRVLTIERTNPVKLTRRSAATAVTSGVAVASLLLPTAANARTTTDPAAAAAGYLARQLAAHHDHLVTVYSGTEYADDGETADAVLSLDAAGVAQHEAALATKWLEQDAGNYLGGTAPDIYPGSAAKLLLVAEAQHVNPTNFGGIDLIGAIVGTEGGGGAPAGEYQNPTDTQYSASVLVQSLAVLALASSSGTASPSASAVSFLAGQQCTNGAFQVAIRPDTSVACANADNDADTTAYAIQALLAAGHHTAANEATLWLAAQERSDGGWGETPGVASDANSTALAVEALIAAHRKANPGVRWLTSHQEGCKAKVGRHGAVRVQGGKYVAATAIRATSQAAVALAGRALSWIDKTGASASAPTLKC